MLWDVAPGALPGRQLVIVCECVCKPLTMWRTVLLECGWQETALTS